EAGLEDQHHAEEAERDEDEEERAVADLVHVLDDVFAVGAAGAPHRVAGEAAERAERVDAGEDEGSDAADVRLEDHLRSEVRKKSRSMIDAAAATTAALTARPTPTAPPRTVVPKWQLESEIASPKNTLFTRPFRTSAPFALSANEPMKVPHSMPRRSLAKSAAPAMATRSPTAVRQRSVTIIATTRGTMR